MVDAARPLVQVRELEVYFPVTRGSFFPRTVGQVRAVDRVSFDIMPGETLGLVGESGSGKSTVGRALMGIDKPTGGRILFDEEDATRAEGPSRRRLARRMQMVFQDSYASVDPRMSVANIIAEPLVIHRHGNRLERRDRTNELLGLVGLPARFATAFPHQLSGGQRQRVGIARALALEPDFVICDEAVSALDVSIQAQIINLLLDLRERLGLTYLFIAHDIAVVRHVAHRTLVMYLGQVMEMGDSDTIVADPLHPYTRALMASVPMPDAAAERARRIHHEAVAPEPQVEERTASAKGCPFAPRCPASKDVSAARGIDCRATRPSLVTVAPGRQVACHLYGGALP